MFSQSIVTKIGIAILGMLFLVGCQSSSRTGVDPAQPRVTIETRTGGNVKVETYMGIVSTEEGIAVARKKAIVLCKKDKGKSDARLKIIFKKKGPPPLTQYGYNCF